MSIIHRVILALGFIIPLASKAASPPEQPNAGPGGTIYKHKEASKKVYGDGAKQFWLYEPQNPRPMSAPLVVFNHGWGGTNPRAYGAWIEHIVRRGNIVVFPLYQDPGSFRYPTKLVTGNALEAVKAAVAELKNGAHVQPELDKVAFVGHSAGGQIAANLAALAKDHGIPVPKAVMPVQPGKSWARFDRINIPLEDMSKIPASVLLVTVVGEDDRVAKDIDAKRIFKESTGVPLGNKDFVVLRSDKHGQPKLVAGHFAPAARDSSYDSGSKGEPAGFESDTSGERSIDALDFYGTWKLFDGLCEAGFYGRNKNYALGNTESQRFMGKWSDGVPVKELLVTKQP